MNGDKKEGFMGDISYALDDKVFVVTGGSRGIGLTMAGLLLAQRAKAQRKKYFSPQSTLRTQRIFFIIPNARLFVPMTKTLSASLSAPLTGCLNNVIGKMGAQPLRQFTLGRGYTQDQFCPRGVLSLLLFFGRAKK